MVSTANKIAAGASQAETSAQAAQTSQNTEGAAQAEEPAETAQASEAQVQTDLLRQICLQAQLQTISLKDLARQNHQNQETAKLNTKRLAAQIEKVMKMLKTDKAEEAETDEPDEPEKAAETHQAEEAAAEVASSASVEIGSQAGSDAGPIYCNACQMHLNGKEQMDDHLKGKKHKKAAQRVRRGC